MPGSTPDGRPDGRNLVRMIPAPGRSGSPDEVVEKAPKKKKDKLRSAWIAFVGRIIAQFIGAAATVGLGLILARHIQVADRSPKGTQAPATPASAALAAPAVARAGVSIAVLPLVNLSGDAEQDYFADSLTEAIITDLAKVRALRVISRTSVMRYKGANRPLPEIARELGASAVVEGSIVRVGDRVRVTAQLIDAATDEHLWAESYERDLKDVLAVQDSVAAAIADEIRGALLDR
jgi:TolB-like protein